MDEHQRRRRRRQGGRAPAQGVDGTLGTRPVTGIVDAAGRPGGERPAAADDAQVPAVAEQEQAGHE